MNNIFIIATFSLAAISVLYLLDFKVPRYRIIFRAFRKRDKPIPVTYKNAIHALDRISSWTTWLTGLQTAAIASIALFYEDRTLTKSETILGFGTLLFFGTSILLATWLLSSLPSIQQRLVGNENENIASKENDIYSKAIFHFVPIRMGGFAGRSILLHP